jgi:TIR domain
VYLASLDTEQDAFVQGMLVVRGPPAAPLSLREQWWDTYRRLMRGITSMAPAGAALRVVLEPGRGVQQALVVAVEQERAARLRRFLAPFTRLETVAPGSGRLPIAKADYDSIADGFPALRCRLAVEPGQLQGAWFACDFRLAPSLETLMLTASDRGHRLGYQINICPLAGGVELEWLRTARRNALTIAELAGVPDAVVAHQRRLSDRLDQARAVYEEYVGVDTPEAAEWLLGELRAEYEAQLGGQRFDEAPEWELDDDGYEDELAYPLLLDPVEMTPAELTAAAVSGSEAEALLSWRAPAELALPVDAADAGLEADDEPPLHPPADLPAACDGNDPFVFISYRRADLERVAPIMREAQQRGRRLWYDFGIPGGSEWGAQLEDRLNACSGVLLFVSQAAVDSRWVRSEAQFANGLGKPILPVKLEPAELRHGMGLLLGQYQMLNAGAPDFLGRLDAALAAMLGRSTVRV